jgi:hypothetical protein
MFTKNPGTRRRNNMKNKLVMAVVAFAILAAAVIMPNAMGTGNGAPSGAHYNLNLIGKDKTDILPNDNQGGNRIFVNLYGRSNIYLQNGTDFAVIDADATDGRGTFQMPAPNNQYDFLGNYIGPGNYTVWVRAVGKPGGNGKITTCAIDPLTLEEVCSTDNVILMRTKGQQKFTDVTKELTTITYYNATLGKDVTVDIFDPSLYGYLWDYDNNGLKTVQLRFYPTS